MHVALTGETGGYYADFDSLGALAKAATRGSSTTARTRRSAAASMAGPSPPEVPTSRLVTFAQDHDQIGNRATGDRLSASLSVERLRVAAVMNLCSPFTPMLFMGEEWGASTPWQFFTSHPEPELALATARGRIEEFARMGWDPEVVPDPQDPATFLRSKLEWSELARSPHRELLALHRELIALRHREPEFADPRFDILSADWDDTAGWFVAAPGRPRDPGESRQPELDAAPARPTCCWRRPARSACAAARGGAPPGFRGDRSPLPGEIVRTTNGSRRPGQAPGRRDLAVVE